MKLYFAGAENTGWRNLLHDEQVPAVSLSFVGLTRKIKKLNQWHLADKFPATPGFRQELLLDSGAYSLNKEGSDYTDVEAAALAAGYFTFVANNIDRIDAYTEFDALLIDKQSRFEAREALAELGHDKFMPIWHSEYGLDELEYLADHYDRVGVLQKDTDGDQSALLRKLAAKTKLHGVAMTRMASMKALPWDSVGSTSWLSVGQFGDTFVWTGNEMKRYPVKYREQSRKRWRTLFDQQGFDPVKIARDGTDEGTSDDRKEVLRLSLFSWSKFVENINLRSDDDPEPPEDKPARGTPRTAEVVVQRDKQLLPILSWAEASTDDGTEKQVSLGTGNLMRCNSCFAKDKCPQFTPDAECAFEIPMNLTTTTQVRSLRKALLGMQAQRVATMRMFEMFEGGYADPNLSSEISRLTKMLKDDADAERERNELEITIRANGNSNLLADVFGAGVESKVNALPETITAQAMIENVLEAEIVDE